jgi:hypothetical protein
MERHRLTPLQQLLILGGVTLHSEPLPRIMQRQAIPRELEPLMPQRAPEPAREPKEHWGAQAKSRSLAERKERRRKRKQRKSRTSR